MRCKKSRWGSACLTLIQVCAALVCYGGAGCGANKAVVKHPGHSGTDESADSDPQEESAPELLPPEHEATEHVTIKTSLGDIVIGLYGADAPSTVKNFLGYVDRGFYSSKVFHRVIPGFMIQGGGFDAALSRAQTESAIKLEIIPGLKHEPGVVSMARTSDPNSATSQFFICVGSAPQLNGGYAAFGKVEKGHEVVQAIASVPTKTVELENGPMADVPSDPVVIEAITRN